VCSDGCVLEREAAHAVPYGEPFETGDVIGCGILFAKQQVHSHTHSLTHSLTQYVTHPLVRITVLLLVHVSEYVQSVAGRCGVSSTCVFV